MLNRGSPAEVRRQVRERLAEVFSRGGGFVFNPVHNILPDVPPQNILAMFGAVAEFQRRAAAAGQRRGGNNGGAVHESPGGANGPLETGGCLVAHREPDRIPFDLGSCAVTGINIRALRRLRARLGLAGEPELWDPVTQLARTGDEVGRNPAGRRAGVSPAPPRHRGFTGTKGSWAITTGSPTSWG